MTVGDVQRAVSSAIGGENVSTVINGRERFPISVRYLKDYRDNLEALRRVLIMTPSGAQIPLGEIATICLARSIDDSRRGRRVDRLCLC